MAEQIGAFDDSPNSQQLARLSIARFDHLFSGNRNSEKSPKVSKRVMRHRLAMGIIDVKYFRDSKAAGPGDAIITSERSVN